MALSLQLGYPDVPKSITNPNVAVNDALDVNDPMPFLTFLKLINVSFEPDSLQSYYNFYLSVWNSKHNSKNHTNQSLIMERYRDFLKELSINYTTLEEKQFLSKIDFNDPYDLDSVMGFYGKKIKDIILFYNAKRNDIKFNIIRKKLIGSNFGAEKTIQELTLSYLKNYDGGQMVYDLDTIKQNLEIEIDELYDAYPKYYNQTPDVSKYDNKDLDYGYDIFLKNDAELINDIFANISEELKDFKEVDQLFENKRKLTRKYISTDFYYLSTGDTVSELMSGKLFDCDNTILNFLNRDYPTTTSTVQSDYLESKYARGFFKPSKTSIIILDGVTKSFRYNIENLSPNTVYYFPDPNLLGDNGNLITFEIDTSFLKRDITSGNAVNQPYSTPYDIKYNGYVSTIDPNKNKYLNSIFDSGFIKDSKKDIYGNCFGLFKNDHRFRKEIKNIENSIPPSLIVDGYTFYDEIFGEGWLFDFSIENDLTYPQRSGLYTNTGTFSTTSFNIVLDFGRYFQYAEPIYDSVFNIPLPIHIIDGAFLTRYDLSLYPDSSSSDLSSYEFDSGIFYYTTLLEGGLYDADPLQRALLDPPLSANFTEYIRGSALNVVEGGHFFQSPPLSYDTLQNEEYYYDDTVISSTIISLSTYEEVDDPDMYGKLFVKNKFTGQTTSIMDAIPYLQYKYSQNIVDELSSNIVDFDVTNDVIFIKTNSYLIVEKLVFDEYFIDPKTNPIYLSESSTPFEKISNPFKNGSVVYYSKLKTLISSISSNDFVIYPEIYKMDVINFKLSKIFPTSVEDITQNSNFLSVSGANIRYVSTDSPKLTYSSRNNIYNISFMMKDQNNMPCLQEFDYYLNPEVVFTKHTIKNFSPFSNSTIFSSLSDLSIYVSSSAMPPTIFGENLII